MGLFGNMDRSKVEIKLDGTELCEWSIETFPRKDDVLADNVKLTWTVVNEESDAFGVEHLEWFRSYPRYDDEAFENLPKASEDRTVVTQKQIRDNLDKLKARLLSLGIAEYEIDADDFDPADLEGGFAEVLFRTSTDANGKKWINLNKITPVNLDVEPELDTPVF